MRALIGIWRRWRLRAKLDRDLRAAFRPAPPVSDDADPEVRALAREMEWVLKRPKP